MTTRISDRGILTCFRRDVTGLARGLREACAVAALAAVCMAPISASPAHAKEKKPPSRTVAGAVLDEAENAIVGAEVQLADLQTGRKVALYSQEGGQYHFSDLHPSHDYEVQANFRGASSEVRQVSSADIRNRIVINLTIALKPLPVPTDQAAPQQGWWKWQNRDVWQRPDEVLNALHLRRGSVVADVGCGNGYFTFRFADRVGPQGNVYAVDTDQKWVDDVRSRAVNNRLVQIKPVLGTPDDPRLPSAALDAILVAYTYHEMHDYDGMLEGFYRALKPRGLLGIIDFDTPSDAARSVYFERHKVPEQTVRDEVTHHHLNFLQDGPAFSIPGMENGGQYFLIFQKPG